MHLKSIEYFRAIAIVLIVAGHCFAISGWNIDTFAELVLANIISGGTSLFVFISGFLFHHVFYQRFNYRKFLIKKFRNVYLPYLFLSTFGIWHAIVIRIPFPEFYFGPEDTLYDQVIRPALLYLWTGGIFAYWYIPFIIGIFLLSPLFIRFIESSRRCRIWLICLTLAVSLFMHRPVNNFSILQSIVFFLPVYLFGIFCSLEKEKIYTRLSERVWFLLAGVVLLAVLQAVYYGSAGNLQKAPFVYNGIDISLLQKLLLSVFFMVFLHRYEHLDSKILTTLASASFAIYFLHGWFIHGLSIVQNNYSALNGLQLLLPITAFVICASYLLARVIRSALPKHSRMLIGW